MGDGAGIYGTNFDAILKEKTPLILKTIFERRGKLMGIAKKDSDRISGNGKYARVPLRTGGNVNDGTRTTANVTSAQRLMPAFVDGQQYNEGILKLINFYQTLYLDRAVVDAQKGNEAAIINLVADEMDAALKDTIKQNNRLLHRDGSGLVAEIVTVNDTTSQVVNMCGGIDTDGTYDATTSAAYNRNVPVTHLRVRKRYQLLIKDGSDWKVTTGTAVASTATSYLILKTLTSSTQTCVFTNEAGAEVTLLLDNGDSITAWDAASGASGSITVATADRFFLVEYGNVLQQADDLLIESNDPYGLLALISDADITPFGLTGSSTFTGTQEQVMNIAGSNSWWQSVVSENSGTMRTFDQFALMDLIDDVEAAGKDSFEDFLLFLNPKMLITVANILSQNEDKIYYEGLRGGYKVGRFSALEHDVGFVGDRDAANNTIQGVSPSNLILSTIFDSIFTWDSDGGSIWKPGTINQQDAIMAVLYGRYNLGINARNMALKYTDLTQSY